MDKKGYIVIQEWMVDIGLKGEDLIAFAIVWDGLSMDWKFSAITNYASRFNIVIPGYIWAAVLQFREERGEK